MNITVIHGTFYYIYGTPVEYYGTTIIIGHLATWAALAGAVVQR